MLNDRWFRFFHIFHRQVAWWRGEDSNLRRLSRQIYSLLPLATRASRRITPLGERLNISAFAREESNSKRVLPPFLGLMVVVE